MNLRNKIVPMYLILVTLVCTSCLQEYRTLILKSDLSGTYSLKTGMDMKPLVQMLEKMGKGDEAASTKEKLANPMGTEEFKQQQEEVKKKLPEGIKLLKMEVKSKDLKLEIFIKIQFSHIRDLEKMKDFDFNPQKIIADQGQGQMGMGMPGMTDKAKRPFVDLAFTEKEDSLIIKQISPVEKMETGSDQDMQAMEMMMPGIGEMVKSVAFHIAIKPPKGYSVADHTADKEKKKILFWIYDRKKAEKLSKSGEEAKPVYVKLQKK